MFVELITTGSELLLGATLNTHQQWLGRQLADLGMPVSRQLTVPDAGSAIAGAVADALKRADLVITTGGLGPTSDDRTREEIARLLGLTVLEDPAVLAQIERVFARRGRPLPPNYAAAARVQAQVPDGARVLTNEHGSAPGLALEITSSVTKSGTSLLVMLPGPPREMQPMFSMYVAPLLKQRFPALAAFVSKTLRTIGVGESRVEELIRPHLAELVGRGLDVGYCARNGEVDVRLGAMGDDAGAMVGEADRVVRRLLFRHIYGEGHETLEEVVIRTLREQKRSVITAESCTGGYVAHCLTNVPGASEVVLGGVVTYSNALKQQLLGVRAGTLEEHGAVSEATAREMAAGAAGRYQADYALAITGIAGPSGGTPEKPVGTVFIALAGGGQVEVQRQLNGFDRETFKFVTGRQGLEMLRRRLVAAG